MVPDEPPRSPRDSWRAIPPIRESGEPESVLYGMPLGTPHRACRLDNSRVEWNRV
jgi:hypothetical protein